MTTFLSAIEILGTVAFAVAGALMGIKKKLDILGIVILGVITACGGGMIRDILLGITPPLLFQNPDYVLIATITSVIVFVIVYFKPHVEAKFSGTLGQVLNLADAIGLGIFAVMGVETARSYGQFDKMFLTLAVGVITGVGGGMLRDILVNEIPFFLRKHIYCIAAFAGSASYYFLIQANCDKPVAMIFGSFLTIFVRVLAIRYKWNLPGFKEKGKQEVIEPEE